MILNVVIHLRWIFKNYYKYTLDINSEQFHNYLNNFIKLYLFWDNYLNKNIVKSIIGVHMLRLRINSKNSFKQKYKSFYRRMW